MPILVVSILMVQAQHAALMFVPSLKPAPAAGRSDQERTAERIARGGIGARHIAGRRAPDVAVCKTLPARGFAGLGPEYWYHGALTGCP